MKWRTLALFASGLIAAGLVLLVSCTPHKPYRVPHESVSTSIEKIRDDAEHRMQVETHCIEEHSDFSLGFVEFDDQGDLWEPRQVDQLESMIREEVEHPESPGALVVVFVHGWKHDATVCDENVACFRELLKGLDNLERFQAFETGVEPRRVIGVYLGWRGKSVTPPVLKEFSFYARKATAHRVGEGRMVEVLTRLENLRDQSNAAGGRSRLVVVGHSFGGAATFSALSNIFEERLAKGPSEETSVIEGFGDLVVLVNPAFEAARYTSIHKQSIARGDFSENQPALLLVVTSESDSATKNAFPAGRTLATLFSRTQSKEQKKTLRTAVGHYLPYRTHFIEEIDARSSFLPDLVDIEEGARGPNDCVCRYIEVDSLTADDYAAQAGIERSGYAGADMRALPNTAPQFNPFPMAGTTDAVVSKHNGIYNRTFVDFLRTYILEMEERRSRLSELERDAEGAAE